LGKGGGGGGVILCSLFFILSLAACELFNNPADPYFLDKLYDEIAWANAKKVTITVAYPQHWGTSLQRGTGRAGDTRVGYAFDIDFTPESEYAFIEWRAYDTNEINKSQNWMNQVNPESALRFLPQLEGIDLPKFGLSGGAGEVKIKSEKALAVTLVPICREQPRVIRSLPDETTDVYHSGSDIQITFAAPLDPETVRFQWDHIRISSRSFNSDTGEFDDNEDYIDGFNLAEKYYADFGTSTAESSYYDNATRTIIIKPIGIGPAANSIITLYLGSRITNNNGKGLEEFTITWKTGGEWIKINDDYSATYNENNGGEIFVKWSYEGPAVNAEVSWVVNEQPHSTLSGGSGLIPVAGMKGSHTIHNVEAFDFNDNDTLRRYEIKILLYIQNGNVFETKTSLLICNIPNTKANNDSGYKLIRNAEDLRRVSGEDVFVLMNNISVSNWTPLERGNTSFKGIFLGNRYAITINGFTSVTANDQVFGLFGNIENAQIYNLTVSYLNTEVQLTTSHNSVRAGAIAGSMTGTNVIEKCITNGYTVRPQTPNNSASWTVDEQDQGKKTSISVSDIYRAHSISADSFAYRVNYPTSDANTLGTLRYGLNASNVNHIIFDNVTPGVTTLALTSRLPEITRSMTIEGNGITITRHDSMLETDESQFLYINNISEEVIIRGVHFKDGRALRYGVAILNRGNLTLESCIFSGNDGRNGTNSGGAIFSWSGKLTVRGCTFYNNHSGWYGGAIQAHGGAVTLSGNLFYGNTAYTEFLGPIIAWWFDWVFCISDGYNIIDLPLGTTYGLDDFVSGFYVHTGKSNVEANFAPLAHHPHPEINPLNVGFSNNTTLPFTSITGADAFTPLGTGTLRTFIDNSTWAAENMPEFDFYGNKRTWPGAPGAVESP